MDMEKIVVDARGCACPEPVLKTKKAIAAGASALTVLVDNNTAVENVKRFAASKGYQVEAAADGADFHLTLKK